MHNNNNKCIYLQKHLKNGVFRAFVIFLTINAKCTIFNYNNRISVIIFKTQQFLHDITVMLDELLIVRFGLTTYKYI